MFASARARGRGDPSKGSRSVSKAVSRAVWSEKEKRELTRKARQLAKRLGRPLRAEDLRAISVGQRTFAAIKSQAARLGLYTPARRLRPWTAKERHVLVILGQKRHLGARGMKSRGFFQGGDGGSDFSERSIDSIAQKKRREGLVDPVRSIRARLARRLTATQKRRLRRELETNPRRKTTEQFAREFGVAPSTIRGYRKRWGIGHSWHEAMSLPAARRKRRRLAAATRERNLAIWKERKRALLAKLERAMARVLARAGGDRKRIAWRTCEKCGRTWPATRRFFAPSPKRRDGRVVAVYLRRHCRVCPRRGGK